MGEVKSGTSTVELRGVLASSGGRTAGLSLTKRGAKLYHAGLQVGRLQGSTMYLCSGAYDATCALRYQSSGKRLLVHFRDRSYGHALAASSAPTPPIPVLPLPGLGHVEVQPPVSLDLANLTVRVRYVPEGGEPTPALEITLRDATDLVIAGRTVGSIAPGRIGLCSGPYEEACDIMLTEDGVVVLPYKDTK
jgi:hypothetical protein